MDLHVHVILTNKYQSTLDGPDEWAKYWISSNHCLQVRVRHQQGRRGSCSGQPSLMMVV